MLFYVLLLSLYAAAAHGQDFVCGFGLGEDEVTAMSEEEIAFYRSSSSTDPIKILPLFGKFKDHRTYASVMATEGDFNCCFK